MAGGGFRLDAEVIEDQKGAETDGPDRRLGDPRVAQGRVLFRAGGGRENGRRINEVAQSPPGNESGILGKGPIGLGKDLLHLRKLTSKIAEHPDVLRALTRKE